MIAYAALRCADLLVRLMPLRASRFLAVMLARLAFFLRLPARRRAAANFERLLGERPHPELEVHARAAFEHCALSIVDLLRLPRLSPAAVRREVSIEGRSHFDGAHRSGRGVILLSVHSGSWEWGACLLAALGPRVHLAARPQRVRAVERWFARQRAHHGIDRLEERPLWSAAARALRRREWVAIMGDRLAPGGRDSVCAWVAAVARRTGAVILPALILRRPGGGYVAHFEAPITPHECRAGGFRRAVRRHLERSPGQWLAFEPLPEGLA